MGIGAFQTLAPDVEISALEYAISRFECCGLIFLDVAAFRSTKRLRGFWNCSGDPKGARRNCNSLEYGCDVWYLFHFASLS
jgi:hypothetical protein